VVVFVAESVYILFASVRGTVGVVQRSCVGWCRDVDGIRRGVFSGDSRYVGWGRSIFYRYVSIFAVEYNRIHPLQKGVLRTSFPRWGVTVL
jgi:hypothetical protein